MARVRDAAKNTRIRGAYYTPADIVSLIVRNTVGRLCEDRVPEQVSELKILDPACGEGAFLTGAYEFLVDRHGSVPELGGCLCGVDIDERALAATRTKLPGADLKRGDSLIDIDWHREFPHVMERGGFDAVIGNPPWASLAGRFGVGAYSEEQIEYLRRRFGGNSYMPNVFEYFISLGMELTRPGGYFSFIVPDRLAFNSQFAELRKRLLTQAELLLLVHGVRFPGVVADTMVFVFRKALPRRAIRTEVREYGGPAALWPQCQFLEHPECAFSRPEDPNISRVIGKMESLPGRLLLKDVCESASGFGGRSGLIQESRTGASQIPVLKGSSIERYTIRKTYWFDFRKENLTGRTADRAKLSARPKILIRKTGNRLIAAYDDSETYPEQSLYFLFNNRTDLDFRFILGVLNSRLLGLYYRTRCLTNRRTFAQVKKADLDRIPLPPIALSVSADRMRHHRIVELVEETLGLHKRLAAAKSARVRDELYRQIGSAEDLIDRLVYELYRLERREVSYVERAMR